MPRPVHVGIWPAVCIVAAGLMAPLAAAALPARAGALMFATWWTIPVPPALPAAASATDDSEQTLAVLDIQVQTAAMLAHFIWQTNRFANFAEGFAAIAPDSAKTVNGAAARYRSDIDSFLDLYATLILQIATGPARLNVSARVDRVEQDMSEQGLVQFKRFLPIILQHVQQIQNGSAPSRERIRAAILALPSATAQPRN